MKKELLSTAIAYANGEPHIGHAFEFAIADALVRTRRLSGRDVVFTTGMDEHGQKIEQKAAENGMSPSDFVEQYARSFSELDAAMSVSPDVFVRTSDKIKHYIGATTLWKTLESKGLLEKRTYKALYCIGCESFKTESDLDEHGECRDHKKRPEEVEEENYFFLLSRFTAEIKDAIKTGRMQILPDVRKNEILALLEEGLQDVSFSRPKEKVSWGIPVPGDDSQVMYVWCDALSNYITAIGYGTESFELERAQEMTHIIGKDILRFHAAIWPGMLLGAGLPLPKEILVHGHITSGGQKMSKSIGNVISPNDVLTIFGPVTPFSGEALRFVLIHEIPMYEDGDLTIESIRASYTAHLVNGIGNLTNRIIKMSITNDVHFNIDTHRNNKETNSYITDFESVMADQNVQYGLRFVMQYARMIDGIITEKEPFKKVKIDREAGRADIENLLYQLYVLAELLTPYMPKTSAKIQECVLQGAMPDTPLFGRLQ